MKSYFNLFVLVFFCLSCNPVKEDGLTYSKDKLKSISTYFISHQEDTRGKDDRKVSEVSFHPDGSLKNFKQFMSYPYDLIDASTQEFWIEPQKDFLLHLMDGLSLAHAERNFLYGNDWPLVYEKFIQERGHPKLPEGIEAALDFTTAVDYLGGDYPVKIVTKNLSSSDQRGPFRGIEDSFQYEKDKVSEFSSWFLIPRSFSDRFPGNKSNEKVISYTYDKDRLVQVTDGRQEYKFLYDDTSLKGVKFFVGETLGNQRIYHYSENGLKEKTEIFNAFGEAEYTIIYEYFFYD